MLRQLTKKEFKEFKKIFLMLTILLIIYYMFFTSTFLSSTIIFVSCMVSFSCFMLFKRHEWYDNKYKEEN